MGSVADTGSDDTALTAAVRAAQQGDEVAFRVLYRAIQPGLIRYLWVQVGDAAEDVASETWLQVTKNLQNFRGDAAGFRGWVATIGRHRAIDYVRHERRQPTADSPLDEAPEPVAAEDTAISALDALSTRDALALIGRLPRDQGEAVLLRAVMGLDAKTAAKVLGKRSGAVRTASYRGLHTLAAYLDEIGASPQARDAKDTRVTQMPAATLKDMR